MFNRVNIIRVVLDENFDITPYLHWFNLVEQKKITSYYHYKDRLISFTSHLLQRLYLPYATNCDRDAIVIDYTTHLKPYISSPKDIAGNFSFNISHCYNQVVLAMYHGNNYAIGVDIEYIDSKIDIGDMAPIVFSEYERKLINNLATNFFKLWTKKESLIKALGTGFATDFYQDTALNLDDFEVAQNYQILTQKIGNYYLSICLNQGVLK